jgi:NADH dehydrogenase
MSVPLEELFQVISVQFVQGKVESIHAEKHDIMCLEAAGARKRYDYDRLVLAAGSRWQRPNLPGLQDYAFDVDQIEGAYPIGHSFE